MQEPFKALFKSHWIWGNWRKRRRKRRFNWF